MTDRLTPSLTVLLIVGLLAFVALLVAFEKRQQRNAVRRFHERYPYLVSLPVPIKGYGVGLWHTAWMDWPSDNCVGDFDCGDIRAMDIDQVVIDHRFELEEDAILFKLRWL